MTDRSDYMKEWLRKDRQRNPFKYRKYKLTYREKYPEKYHEENKKRWKKKQVSEVLNVALGWCMNHACRPFGATSTRLCDECLEKRREVVKTQYHAGVSMEVLQIFRNAQKLPTNARLVRSVVDEKYDHRSFEYLSMGVPQALFGGRLYARMGALVEAGKMIVAGKAGREIYRQTGIDARTVSKFRKILVEECGVQIVNCICGREPGHWGRCDQGKGRRRTIQKTPIPVVVESVQSNTKLEAV